MKSQVRKSAKEVANEPNREESEKGRHIIEAGSH